MTALDAMLAPFALWLGLGLIKGAAVLAAGWLAVIVWRGTTDGNGMGD